MWWWVASNPTHHLLFLPTLSPWSWYNERLKIDEGDNVYKWKWFR